MALVHSIATSPFARDGQGWTDLRNQQRSVQMRSRKGLVQGRTASQRKSQAGFLSVAAACPFVPPWAGGKYHTL